MKVALSIIGWILRFVLYILFAVITGILEGITMVSKSLRDKCQPR